MSTPFNFSDSNIHRPVMFATLGFGLGALTLALVSWFTDYISNREKSSQVRAARRISCPTGNVENTAQTDSIIPPLRPSRSESELAFQQENSISKANISVIASNPFSSEKRTCSIGVLVRPEDLESIQPSSLYLGSSHGCDIFFLFTLTYNEKFY